MEIAELWDLFKQWHAQGNDGTLKLDEDGSGGIEVTYDGGDHWPTEMVVSWDNLAQGVEVMRHQIAEHCPAYHEYLMRRYPDRRRRRARTLFPVTAVPSTGSGPA